MQVKVRFLADKLNSFHKLIETKNLQLGTIIYGEKFPINKDVGVLTVLEGVKEEENKLRICVRNSRDEILGYGATFKIKLITRESSEGIAIYNINNTYFENENDFYTIELWNDKTLVDKFKLSATNDIYKIYDNLDNKGVISLL